LKLFLERGVEAVTIDDIAHEAGIAKGSFYRYFADKEELVAALFEPVAHRAREAFFRCEEALRGAHDRASLLTAYQGLARDLIPLATEHGDEVRLYLQEHRTPPVGARAPIRALALEVEQRAVHLTKVAVDRGLLRISDPRISALAVIGAVEQLALGLFAGRLDASPSLVATTLIELVLEGIRIRS
jgi:AcrR family transcriptional regulator